MSALRVVIIGTGFMAGVHAQAWAQTPAQVTAFVARDGDEEAKALAARHKARLVTRMEDSFAGADVVDICTPTHLHAEFTLRAAEAGKHVICEKPLALTVQEGREMIRACRRHGVRMLVAHVLRFFPEYRQAYEMAARGTIGTPAVLRLSRCVYRPRKADNWFVDPARSGGMMLDLMVHDFDFARWVAGDVQRVYARSVAAAHPEAGVDHALVILTHHNGAISHVEGSWAFPPPTFRTRVEIAGSAGLIAFDSASASPIDTYLHQEPGAPRHEVPLPRSPLRESPYAIQLRTFAQVLADGAAPPVTAADGLAAVQMAAAAVESAQSGSAVELAPLEQDA